MNTDISSKMPPKPQTAGRKKIKIQRIEDSRNRQVTFLKRKNGLLKKAMELGILCDCEVTVIIFNLNNGKLFEYSSVEPEQVLQKYATYSGPSERRKKDRFFELAAAKGSSNIPVNEPNLAQAAMDAAAAAVRRPRPTHKFKNSESEPSAEQYYNGRKLSSGESPGNQLLLHTPREVGLSAYTQPSPSTAIVSTNPQHLPPTPISATPRTQNLQLLSSKLPFMPFTPRLSADIPVPPLITPNTAGRQLSSAFGLPTPSVNSVNSARFPFSQLEKEPEQTAIGTLLPPPPSNRPIATPKREQHVFRPTAARLQSNEPTSLTSIQELTTPKGPSTKSQSNTNDGDAGHVSVISSEGAVNSVCQRKDSNDNRSEPRARPNLTVVIPNPNREDHASDTPSGLHSMSSPSSGNEPFRGLMSARLPGISPTGQGMWGSWNHLGSGERDIIPVPLTPFLNYNLDGVGEGAGMGFGGGHHFSLPSPIHAGLMPLTPRILGFDPLATSRAEGQQLLPSKRGFDQMLDQNSAQNHQRPSS